MQGRRGRDANRALRLAGGALGVEVAAALGGTPQLDPFDIKVERRRRCTAKRRRGSAGGSSVMRFGKAGTTFAFHTMPISISR